MPEVEIIVIDKYQRTHEKKAPIRGQRSTTIGGTTQGIDLLHLLHSSETCLICTPCLFLGIRLSLRGPGALLGVDW